MKLAHLKALLMAALLTLPGQCADARQAIQAAYEKTCEAAALKFVDGIRSIRAPKFEAFNPDGKMVDLVWERNRYDRLLSTALSVKKTVKMLSFQQVDDSRALCRVQEIYTMSRMNPITGKPIPVLFESISDDEWVLTRRGWKLQRSRVKQQVESTVSEP